MNISMKTPKTLLTKTSGFLNDYSHSLNPYTGCAFGCSYCYVRRLPVSLFRKEEWGTWVDIKAAGKEQLKKELLRAKKKGPVRIFMSSSTDPYQGTEAKEQVTRTLLEAMTEEPPDFLFVQTRSPLSERDEDLFRKLGSSVLVSMTIETDREDIRRAFAPSSPPIAARLKALRQLKSAGIPVQAAVAPLLPFTSEFPEKLKQAADLVTLDDFFLGDGAGGKRSASLGVLQVLEGLGEEDWFNPERLVQEKARFEHVFGRRNVRISQDGFAPFRL
ncbi:radical SAM protein [Bacillus mangrovi]|uniref:Radical SAM protein n=1 Tax=Metabacillus mangrovi TaxID=1491830 RepID=A0A7X2S4E9_9BACI|nr:radical SAM protein [Metabacillus mangrovi]MTH53315.1 radical SAM protein [Metabacillus mangrovi]